MFIQVIQAKAADADALRAQFDKWQKELREGADGFLGSTGGVTPDGQFIELARFESPEAATANSARPEQGAWWEETAKLLGDVSFVDCEEAELVLGGGDNAAGFVQIMQGRTTDRERLRAAEETFVDRLPEHRPEVKGMVRAWHPDGETFTQAVYFRSEAEARQGEKQEPPAEIAQNLQAWDELLQDMRFFDLPDPFLI